MKLHYWGQSQQHQNNLIQKESLPGESLQIFLLVNVCQSPTQRIRKIFYKQSNRERDNGILCSFLRESTKAGKTFVFPHVEHVWEANTENVVNILKSPKIIRASHIFKDNINVHFQ